MSLRKLIVTADDFGRIHDDDLAIIKAHLEGIVTSTSVFSTHKNLAQSAKILAEVATLRTGVHLDLTSGTPCAADNASSSVVKSNGEFTLKQKSMAIDVGKIYSVTPADLAAEFTAQIELFQAAGLVLGHLDNHLADIYLSTGLFAVCIELAHKYNVPLRTPFDRAFGKKTAEYSRLYGYPEDQIIAIYERSLHLQTKQKTRSADYFHIMTPDICSIATFANWLTRLPSGTTELCTHPGANTEQGRAEFAVLTAPEVRAEITRLGIELVGIGYDYP